MLRHAVAAACAIAALFAVSAPTLAFEEKPFVKPVNKKPPAGTVADFAADRVTYDPRTKLATASGRVVITYGVYVLNATRVTYNQDTGVFTANGSVELREPNGNVLQAATLELRNKFKEGFARHLKALLTNDVTITAQYARRQANGITVYDNVHYTACKNCETRSGDPLWELVSDQTTHDEKAHTLYHVNPRLKIGGATVLALPYLEHADPSVKRRTGWLVPNVKTGKVYGAGLVTPYFYVVAPNKDLTFRPMFTAFQGPVADVEWRHRTATGQYSVRAMGLYELSPGRSKADEEFRGALRSKGDFALNEDWTWGWDGTAVTDRRFLNDYDYDGTPIMQSQVYARGLSDRDYVSAQALHFQAMDDTVDSGAMPTALPYAYGEHYLDDPVLGGDLSFNWSVYSLQRDVASTPFTDVNHGTTQSRATADLRWKTRLIGDAGQVITPFASLRSDLYVNNNLPDPAAPGGFRDQETTMRVLPAAGVDMRWPFIASHQYGQSIWSPVMQVIAAGNEKDPNAIGNEDAITLNFDHTSLFLEDRFTGLDRFESGVRTNVGMTYTFLGQNGGFVRASAGESFHIAGKNSFVSGSGLDGSSSDLVGSVLFQPWDSLGLSYEVRAEEDLSAINRQELNASLTFDSIALNASYLNIDAEPAYGRLVDEQWVGGDFRVGLSDGWYLFGGLRYNLENSGFLAKSLGVEFDCDCMNFKVAYSENESSDTGETERKLMMSIDLATLGGTQVSSKF